MTYKVVVAPPVSAPHVKGMSVGLLNRSTCHSYSLSLVAGTVTMTVPWPGCMLTQLPSPAIFWVRSTKLSVK